jgi:hypothetical protein
MQIVHISKALDSLDLASLCLDCKHQAGSNRFSVKKYGARAAHAVLAAHVRAGQAQVVSQEVTEQQSGLHLAGI